MADEGQTLAQLVRDKYPGAYDDLSDHELEGAVQRRYPGVYADIPKSPWTTERAEDYYTPNVFQQDIGTSVGQAVSGAAKNVGGMGRQLLHMVTQSPIKTLEEATASRRALLDKAETAESLPEKVAYNLTGRIPFLGPMIASAGERLGSGDPETMGAGASDIALMGTASPTARAGMGAAGKSAAATVAKLPGVNRVAPAVREAVKDPLVALVGAAEGYSLGGVPGAIAGGLGAPIGLHGTVRTLGRILRGEQGAGAAKPPAPKDPMDVGMREAGKTGREAYENAGANDRLKAGMSVAGREANPNAGGRMAPEQSVDSAVREAVGDMRGERTGQPVLHPPDLPRVVARRTDDAMSHVREVLERQMKKKAERQQPAPPAASTPAPAPKAQAAQPAAAAPEPKLVGKSKTKRPTYSENDLKAARDKWGSTDIVELRQKHGEAVDAYLLEQRALRHNQHYTSARDLASARKADLDPLGATATLTADMRKMLLDSLKQRSGKK